ncbi:ComEC family competence protein [compost metagenome]
MILMIGCSAQPTSSNIETKAGLKIHFIDVGQGASQLIIGPTGQTMLIDAGNNDKEKLMVDYLNKLHIKKIDILIGTHPDADHIGGLDAVINHFDIGKVYMPKVQANTKTFEDVLTAIQKKGLKVTTAKAGVQLDWEADTTVTMVGPVGTYEDTNEMSAVLRLTYGDTSFLLTGDAEAQSEKDMLDSKVNLQADVLLVGHHGSNSSTSKSFLEAVKPKYGMIQVGVNNYGHPTAQILKRLKDQGVQIYRNDLDGHVIFYSDGKQITVKQEKSSASPTSKSSNSKQQGSDVIYNSCAEVKAAGKAPLRKGDPGYNTKLDGDQDGIACE